jgi:hypothetical protein
LYLKVIEGLAQALAAMRGRAREQLIGERIGCAMVGNEALLQGAMQPLGCVSAALATGAKGLKTALL